MSDIRLDIETRLASTRLNVADIRNFIFHNVYGSMRVGFLDEKETFIADAVIEKIRHMSGEDLMREVVKLDLSVYQLDAFEKSAIEGKYPSSVWTPFMRRGSKTLTDEQFVSISS
jgi:hypothetical protein|tara:strand:- start:568 stop:912 length:345 start_codon:yes stop_codon:yes gene_type:complete